MQGIRSEAKVGTLARCATMQTLQLTQPDQIAPLLRDRSAFVQIELRALAESFGSITQRHSGEAQKRFGRACET
jgi:hypothetical protein